MPYISSPQQPQQYPQEIQPQSSERQKSGALMIIGAVIIIAIVVIAILVIVFIKPEKTKKEEALEFSLEVVETYFTRDVDKFASYLADTTYRLDKTFTKNEIISLLKEKTPPFPGEDYSDYTIDDYLENYNPKILNYEEYSKEYPYIFDFSFDDWKPNEDDFLFIGYEIKTGKEEFMWDDLLMFMVTYQNKKWEFIRFFG